MACQGRPCWPQLLLRRWAQAKAGGGKVVLIGGEPGIGKSRLARAFQDAIAGEAHVELRFFCSPHHQDSALYPHIAQLERAAGVARDDTDDARLAKLDAVLAQSDATDEAVALIAELLSTETDQRERIQQMTPQARRERTLAALLAQLAGLAARQPVLMIYEDVHWIDPSSRELLDRTIERLEHLPVLLLATFCPEFQPPWAGQPNVASLMLARLNRPNTAVLIAGIVGEAGLPPEVVEEIAKRTDGVPLFVEEVTRAAMESEPQAAHALLSIPHPTLSVPATLHASLVARLDRLGPVARDVAQRSATIGREFSYELIAAVADRPEPELREGLERLTSAGLLFARGAPPDCNYLFKHALLQDMAYGTLPKARRQELHGRIARAFEDRFPDVAQTQPELLAHHYTEARQLQEAIQYWRRAGERALGRYANPEGIAHLTRGIEIIESLPESPQRDEQEFVFQVALVAPLWATRGFGSAEAERASRRAVELCQCTGFDTPLHFRALYGLAYSYLIRGDLRKARPVAEQMLRLAERLHDPQLLAYAHFEMGCELLWSAELNAARDHLEQGIALHDPAWGSSGALRFAFDSTSNCHSFLARVLCHLGYPDKALRHGEEAVAVAARVSHPFSQGVAHSWTTALHQLRGERSRTQELAEIGLSFATEQVFPFLAAHAMVFLGWALAKGGHCEEGIARLHQGIAAYRETGAELESSHWLGLLADAYLDTGQAREGLCVVSEALDHVEQTGIVYYEAELHRIDGEVRLRLDSVGPATAEACFNRAIDTAKRQGAKSWELRAATSLARLWRNQGRIAEAHDLLAPIRGWFTEGFGTKDLVEAKALLDALELGFAPFRGPDTNSA